MFLVVTGNPFDGLTCFGPFYSHEDAERWATNECRDEWNIITLHDPVEEDDGSYPGDELDSAEREDQRRQFEKFTQPTEGC